MGGITILLVDDEVKVTQFVSAYLEKEGYRVIVAHDGDRAIDLAFSEKPDLILLDLNLPKFSGEEVCKMVRAQSRVPIIMLTAKAGDANTTAGLDLGADDYVAKPFSPRELMARIRAVLRRSSESSGGEESLSFGDGELVVKPSRHEVFVRGESVVLTAKEFALLHLLAKHPGAVLTRVQLSEAINGYAYESSDRTIDSHIRNLRAKIELQPNQPRYVKTVFGVGYKFGE